METYASPITVQRIAMYVTEERNTLSIVTKHLQDVQDQDQLFKTVCQPKRIKDAFQKLKLDRLDNTLLFSKMETHASPIQPMGPFAILVEDPGIVVQRHLQDVQDQVELVPTRLLIVMPLEMPILCASIVVLAAPAVTNTHLQSTPMR